MTSLYLYNSLDYLNGDLYNYYFQVHCMMLFVWVKSSSKISIDTPFLCRNMQLEIIIITFKKQLQFVSIKS